MSSWRQVQQPDGSYQMIEITRTPSINVFSIRADVEPFRSPVDGTMINTRTQLLAHNQRHSVTNDIDSLNEKAQRANTREPYTGSSHERKLDIADSLERVKSSGFSRKAIYDE